jgi:hypothetical protein
MGECRAIPGRGFGVIKIAQAVAKNVVLRRWIGWEYEIVSILKRSVLVEIETHNIFYHRRQQEVPLGCI